MSETDNLPMVECSTDMCHTVVLDNVVFLVSILKNLRPHYFLGISLVVTPKDNIGGYTTETSLGKR